MSCCLGQVNCYPLNFSFINSKVKINLLSVFQDYPAGVDAYDLAFYSYVDVTDEIL